MEELSLDGVYVCQTCVTGCGYRWPVNVDAPKDLPYVERCDMCDRFESDAAAFAYLVTQLRKEGFAISCGTEIIRGYPQPWIRVLAQAVTG